MFDIWKYLRIIPTDICLKASTKQPSTGAAGGAENHDEESY